MRAFDPGKGSLSVKKVIAFAANTPKRVDIVGGPGDRYRHGQRFRYPFQHRNRGWGCGDPGSTTAAGPAVPPLNATPHVVPDPAKGPGKTKVVLKLVTAAGSGSYSARVRATGGAVTVSANEGVHVLHARQALGLGRGRGEQISGINFSAFDNGTITGRVVDADDTTKALSGVIVERDAGRRNRLCACATPPVRRGATSSACLTAPTLSQPRGMAT